jgi:hypothetical protein
LLVSNLTRKVARAALESLAHVSSKHQGHSSLLPTQAAKKRGE